MWKPIDTAPKDGTYVLVKCKGNYVNDRTYVPAVAAYANGAWRDVDDSLSDITNWVPDFWMELPPSEDGTPYVNIYDR